MKKMQFNVKKFIDVDKDKEIFYINYYVDDFKIVVKTLIDEHENLEFPLKIDKFDLTKYTYLTPFS